MPHILNLYKFKHIIFDLDGTLIDSSESILFCFNEILKKNKIIPIRPVEKSLIGPPLSETIKTLTGFKDEKLILRLCDDFKLLYDNGIYKLTNIFPGIIDVLNLFYKSNLQLYIITNKRSNPTKKIIDYFNWSHYFKAVYSIDSFSGLFGSKKQIIKHVIEIHNIPKSNVVYIGDRMEDLDAAQSNDLAFIGVKWGTDDWINFSTKRLMLLNYPNELMSVV